MCASVVGLHACRCCCLASSAASYKRSLVSATPPSLSMPCSLPRSLSTLCHKPGICVLRVHMCSYIVCQSVQRLLHTGGMLLQAQEPVTAEEDWAVRQFQVAAFRRHNPAYTPDELSLERLNLKRIERKWQTAQASCSFTSS